MMTTKDIDHGWKAIKAELEKAQRMEVAVGVLAGSSNSEGASIAEYGAYNEFGTSKIPSRPFMATSFDENLAQINNVILKQYKAITNGAQSANGALTYIGSWMQQKIQRTITGRNFLPALSPRTVARKKNKSTKTLVDTGALVNAIQLSIRSKSQK